MTTSPAGVAGVFDRAAGTYDAVGVPWFGPIAAGLVEELAVTAGERVLDVGCGRGAALLPLAEAAGPTGHVLGIDLAPEMVRRTASDIAGLAHVQVRAADASAPGLPSASYDVVASSLVQFFLPDPANAVRTWVDPATLLRDAWLDEVRTTRRTVPARFTGPPQWVDFAWWNGQRAMWEAVPPDEHEGLVRRATTLLSTWEPLAFSQVVRHTLGRRPA